VQWCDEAATGVGNDGRGGHDVQQRAYGRFPRVPNFTRRLSRCPAFVSASYPLDWGAVESTSDEGDGGPADHVDGTRDTRKE